MKLTFTLFLFSFFLNYAASAQATDTNDSLALVDLYNSTNGAGWTHNTNWLSPAPVSTWYGITVMGTRVTSVDLGVNNLTGALPSSIGNLGQLQYLHVYFNQLSGTIPYSIGNLVNLYELTAGNNQLTGAIPSSIGKLTKLQQLDLSMNQLSDSIPMQIGNLVNAQFINLSGNQLTGAIPSSIGKLVTTQVLELSENQLTGAIPQTIGKLTNLLYLYLQDNNLSGAIPSNLGSCTSLTALYLNNNALSGLIPSSLTNLTNLQLLLLNDNQLSGALPTTIGKLTSLGYLYLDHNQLSGPMPASLSKLTNLQYLYLDHNQFSQSTNKNPPLPMNVSLYADISSNGYSFNGLEFVAMHYPFSTYSPQATVDLHQNGDTLSVGAGGTLSNNTYTWYQTGVAGSTVLTGDSTFRPTASGQYYATVRNAVATQLILYSDTITYTAPLIVKRPSAFEGVTALRGVDDALLVYPNPAKDVVHMRLAGTAVVVLRDAWGRTVQSATIAGTGVMDVSRLAAGTYSLQDVTSGKVVRILVVR